MSLKQNEWIGRVLIEVGSNRSKAQVLDWRHGKDELWKKNISCLCVNGHFTGKPHWDRVDLYRILTWITFWCWVGSVGILWTSLLLRITRMCSVIRVLAVWRHNKPKPQNHWMMIIESPRPATMPGQTKRARWRVMQYRNSGFTSQCSVLSSQSEGSSRAAISISFEFNVSCSSFLFESVY